jgi:hypothetical protein
LLRLLAQVHATVTIISSEFRAPAAAPSLASDFQASFVHCGVSVPPLESPHQDPRSPCQRIRQPTPPGLYFFPTGTLVPACPDCSQDQGPNKARLRKKSSSFFLNPLPHYDSSHDSLSVSPHPSLSSSRFSRLFPCACFGNLAVTVTVVFVGA